MGLQVALGGYVGLHPHSCGLQEAADGATYGEIVINDDREKT
jgi:hypothetical protein